MTDDTAVKVAVRIRPLISRDIFDLCHVCTKTAPNEPQIWIGNDKSYTFDYVFDMPTPQDEIFNTIVQELVEGCFDGYNATVLAYGQTGSGKTYTMGTGFDSSFNLDERGIIPRAVEYLFKKITEIQEEEKENRYNPPEFNVHAQFMELYNEEVIDLLDTTRDLDNKNKKAHVRIHEDADGKIYTHGVIAQCVTNVQEALHCLKIGSLSRTTASTGMNKQSSRSHAIFTLHIKQKRMSKPGTKMSDGADTCNSTLHKHTESLNEVETLTAKFHFVDLAGSERLKRTGATGDRQKESICINSGLLALGNVISALGDRSKKATHIPYRDSKLTRLLQDSLGGNSRTLMIACVSPSDRDFVETLSTLKYANRAKNIRNKVVANKDKSSQTINALIKQVESLQMELMEFRQGKRIVRDDGVECINDMYHENTMLQSENNSLKTRIKAQQQTIEVLSAKNAQLEAQKRTGEWNVNGDGAQSDLSNLVLGYVSEIESLRAKLIESENANALLRKSSQKASPQYAFTPTSTVAITGHYDIRIDTNTSVTDIIEEARKNVKKLKRKERKLKGEKETNEKAAEEEDEKELAEELENAEDVEEDDSSSESDSEKTDPEQKLSENVADITCDISLKEKLIQMLEMSQRRIHNLKNYYEEKLAQLQTKILEAEKERDKIISNLNKNAGSKSEERKIRADYEKKISSLRNDVQQFENAKRNHAQLLSSASESEAKLKKLKQEVAEMKRAKVALLTKMKEEAKKFRESEQKRNREIAQLKKEKSNKDTKIRALEAEKRRKDIVLKRRADEIQSLKKKVVVKYVSPRSVSRLKAGNFQHKLAKQRWQQLENKINKLVLNRQSVAIIEKDMDRWLKEREKIGHCLDKLSKKKEKAIFENKGLQVIIEIDDEIESLRANIEYINENLSACQTAITGLEEAKEQINPEDIINTLNNMPLEESHYVIEKILLWAVDQSFQSSQKDIIIKELDSHLSQVKEHNAVQEQLLYHVLQQANVRLAGFLELSADADQSEHSENDAESRSASPEDSMPNFSRESTFVSEKQKRRKARNMPVTTEQLLFSSQTDSPHQGGMDDITSENIQTEMLQAEPVQQTNTKSLSYVILPAPIKDHNGNNSLQTEIPAREEMPAIMGFRPIIANSGVQNSCLMCSHFVEGHDQAVLCVECTDDVLFSGSEDGLIKIWDLATGTEIQSMNHISAVRKVCYCEYTRRTFSASSSAIKLWDVRQNPAACTHTFWASGQLRRIKDPSLGPEYEINDICLNQYGTLLYGASSRSVQIFDLRMLQCIGALDVGYKSNVLCLAVSDTDFGKNRIICGTEDKAIKIFEIREDDYGIHQPKFCLSLQHTDGIEALALIDNILFSSSRDKSLRKWNLETKQTEYVEYRAHDEYISALNILQGRNQLISGCKSGYLKLWSTETCKILEEIKGHQSSINGISSNSSLIFTASNDCTVGVWKMKSQGCTGLRILN